MSAEEMKQPTWHSFWKLLQSDCFFPVSSTTSHERLFALFHSEEARRKSPSALWLRTTDGDVLLSMNSLEPAEIKPLGSTPETLCVPKRLSNGNCFLWENSLKPIHVNYKTWIMVCFSISSGLIFPLHHFLLMHKPPLRDCGAEIRKGRRIWRINSGKTLTC